MLYVPATNERFVAKAAQRDADAIILDLEDSIPEAEKGNARAALSAAVATCRSGDNDIWVRVNRPIRQCVRDIEAAVTAGADGILLPKAESPQHVRLVAEAMADAEAEAGQSKPLSIILIIEDPAAVMNATEIVTADERVKGAAAGGEDLATALDAVPSPETLRVPKLLVHMAAKAGGRASLGTLGTVADYSDTDAIRAMIAEARRHGFDGASCIHPSIVALLNEGFNPSANEIVQAERIIAALEAAERDGRGAVSLDGKMIDKPVADRARRLLARVR